MSNSKRAIRRHHRARLNKRARFIVTKTWSWADYNEDYIMWLVNRRRDNMQMCSCMSCGNPRHSGWHEELTMQEKKQLDSEKDQWNEVDNPLRV